VVKHDVLFVVLYFLLQSFSLEILLSCFKVFCISIYKSIVNGISEIITDKNKNSSLFQKSAPSIIQIDKKANKFKKIIKVIFKIDLIIKN